MQIPFGKRFIYHYVSMLFIIASMLSNLACKTSKAEIVLQKFDGKNKLVLKEKEFIRLEEKGEQVIGMPISMQVDMLGNIYLSDLARLSIHVYNKQGKFKRGIGRAGEAPNELQGCIYINLYNNKLSVLDDRLDKIVFYDTSGVYLDYFSLVGDQKFRPFPGYFDYSPDGEKLYVGGLSNMEKGEYCKKTHTIYEFDKNMQPVSLGGGFDPYSWNDYCEHMSGQTMIKTDKHGNIYTLQIEVPRITKYDSQMNQTASFLFQSEEFKLPYGKHKAIEEGVIPRTRIEDWCIGEKTGRIFILHAYHLIEKGSSKIDSYGYLTVLSPEGEILAADISVYTPCIAIDEDENLYYFKNWEPENMVLAKSVLETI